MAKEENELKCVSDDTKIIILGTFPSKASRKKWFYHKSINQFWKIMSIIFKNEEIKHLAKDDRKSSKKEKELIEKRKNFLKSHRIGLWDVIKTCDIEGSLDSAIKNPEFNDLANLKKECPNLKCICFSSQKAFKYYAQYLKTIKDEDILNWFEKMTDKEKHILPSPSSANARMTVEEKISQWQKILYEFL